MVLVASYKVKNTTEHRNESWSENDVPASPKLGCQACFRYHYIHNAMLLLARIKFCCGSGKPALFTLPQIRGARLAPSHHEKHIRYQDAYLQSIARFGSYMCCSA